MQGGFLWVKPMAKHSLRRLRPNCAMSVNDLAPASIAMDASVSMAASECRVPRGSRGSDKPKKSSYNDGTAAAEASVPINLNPLGLRIDILAMKMKEN